MALDLPTLDALLSPGGRTLTERATAALAAGDDVLAVTSRLRGGTTDAALVAAAVGQARLRLRARDRFGADADLLVWTPDGLEQATRPEVAVHRAARIALLHPARVADLCCGVGGDLAALATAAPSVLAVDRDPVTAAVARANAEALGLADRVEVRVDDVTATDLAGCDVAYVDPARRRGGRRTFDPAAYDPPFAFVTQLADRVAATAAKVAPGIPHDLVPDGAEAEWVSYGRDLKEAALWLGPLAGIGGPARRRATLLPAGTTLVDDPATPPPRVGPAAAYLHEPADAVIRAGLVGEVAALLDGWLLDRRIAYVCSETASSSPFTRAYEVLETLPFALKRLRAAVRRHDPRDVVVKTRGSALDPAQVRRDLRPSGSGAVLTVLLTRVGDAPLAVLARALG